MFYPDNLVIPGPTAGGYDDYLTHLKFAAAKTRRQSDFRGAAIWSAAYAEPNAVSYASHTADHMVQSFAFYDKAGNVIETHELLANSKNLNLSRFTNRRIANIWGAFLQSSRFSRRHPIFLS
jgi:hypothetical protein